MTIEDRIRDEKIQYDINREAAKISALSSDKIDKYEYRIRDEKIQYDINREAAKISALSSDKIDKYEYLTGEEILPSNQQQIIEQAKFTYPPLGKAFDRQTKTIEDQGEKQLNALKSLKSSDKQLPSIKDVISKENLNP